MAVLGESIIGFDQVIKDIFKITKINASINISVNKTRKGSFIVDIILAVIENKNILPFEEIIDLLNFLEVTSLKYYNDARDFFGFTINSVAKTHRTLNDYFAKNPLDQNLITAFIVYIFGKIQWQKKHPNFEKLKKEYAIAAHKLIKKHTFKKALKPFIDEKIKSISLSNDPNFKEEVFVNQDNFDNYLSEEEKILPQYENGEKYLFTGKIVAMQCSKGDSLRLHIHGFSRKERDIIAYPPEGKTTKDLEKFYEEDVTITAIVERKSFYQKPKLHILEIKFYNQPMF